MKRMCLGLVSIGTCVIAFGAAAQVQRQPGISPVEVQSSPLFASVTSVRELPNGTLLVNDRDGRQLLQLDAALRVLRIVADTTPLTDGAYGDDPRELVPLTRDLTLFANLDYGTPAAVIDANGAMSAWSGSSPAANVCQPARVATDTSGVIACIGRRYSVSRQGVATAATPMSPKGERLFPRTVPDSVALVRYDLMQQTFDTIGQMRSPVRMSEFVPDSSCRWFTSPVIEAVDVGDGWAMTTDGTVGILRSGDSRVDWITPDGALRSSSPLPHSTMRLNAAMKAALVDSTMAAAARLRPAFSAADRNAAAACNPKDVRAVALAGPYFAGLPKPLARSTQKIPLVFAQPQDLPDILPPFVPNSMIGDRDGRVWIRATEPDSTSTVYLVVDPRSDSVTRVLLPRGRVVVGFGAGGVVYMVVEDGTRYRIERARMGIVSS